MVSLLGIVYANGQDTGCEQYIPNYYDINKYNNFENYNEINDLIKIKPSCSHAWCIKGHLENILFHNEKYYSWANCSYLNQSYDDAHSNISQFFNARDKDSYPAAWPYAWSLRAKIADKLEAQNKSEASFSWANYYNWINNKNLAYNYIAQFFKDNDLYPYPDAFPDAWRLRAIISERFPNNFTRKTESCFCWANYYNLINKNSSAYGNISEFFNVSKNYPYYAAFPDAWNLVANILDNSSNSQDKTDAYYYKAKYYYDLSDDNSTIDYSKEALQNINTFLNDTYQENITASSNLGGNFKVTLSDAWDLRGRILQKNKGNETEINFCRAYWSYYRKDTTNALNMLNNFTKEENNTQDTLYLRGLILENNDTKNAADLFKQAIKSNNYTLKNLNIFNSPTYYKIIGDCLISAGKNANDFSNGHYYLAKHHFALNQYDEARKEINMSVEMNPHDHDAWWLRGEISNKFNPADAANYCFAYSEYLQEKWNNTYGNLDKTNANNHNDALILKGMILEKRGFLRNAQWAFENATNESIKNIFPNDQNESLSLANWNCGRIKILLDKNYSVALDDFGRSLAYNVTKLEVWTDIGVALFNEGKFEESQSIFNYHFDTNGFNKSAIFYNKEGEILASMGWFNASLGPLNAATNESKSFRRAWYNKGLAKINLKRYRAAIQDLDNAIYNASGSDADKDITAKAWMNKAVANSSLHKYYDALIDVEHSIELKSSNETQIDAYYTKGLILLSLKRASEANQSFSMALGINGSNPEALQGLGRARAMKNDLQGALESYDKCLSIDKNNEQAWLDKGTTEKLLGMEGESLISFHKALDAIKHNRVRILCDIGYAWQMLSIDQKASITIKGFKSDLDPFNESIRLDRFFADAYYNKSFDLFSANYTNAAQSVLKQALDNDSSLDNDYKFNYLSGMIYKKQGQVNLSIESFIKSYNKSQYDIHVLIGFTEIGNYEPKIKEFSTLGVNKTDELIRIVDSIKKINKSNSKGFVEPTIDDLRLMLEKLNQSNDVESNLLLAIADSEYHLSLTDDAIQNYIKVRQTSELDEMDNIGKTIIKDLYLLSFILGLLYFILIILNFAEAKFGRLLILSNSIGFLALDYLLSRNFDASRAMWSLIVQCIILSTSILFIIVIFKFRERKWLSMSEMALRNVVTGQIQCCKLFLLSFSFVLLSACLVFFYPREMDILNLNSFVTIRYFMALTLVILILATVVPIGLALASGKVSSDLRRFFSVAQVTYIAICAVPLSWLFWSLGEPIGFSDTISIEDKTIPIPWYTLTLLVLFSLAFIYPYFKGHNEYNRRTSNMLDSQKELISDAEKLINNIDKSIDRNCTDLVEKIEKGSRNEFPELGKLDDNDPMIIIPQISQEIAELAMESIRKHNFHNVDLMDQSSFRDPSCKDHFAALNKQITDLESKEIKMAGLSYYGCHSEYNRWILNTLTKQKGWVSEAERLAIDTAEFSRKCSHLIMEIKKGFEKEFPELRKTNNNDTTMIIPPISQEIAELAKESTSKHNFHIEDPMDQMSSKDPFAELKKRISDLDPKEIDRSVVWTGYVSVFIAPAIALVISLVAPMMGVPMDQGNLSQLITNAVSQTTIGI